MSEQPIDTEQNSEPVQDAPATEGKHAGGRPTDCTPETTRAIAQAISLGSTYKDAALSADVTYTSFRNWMVRGQAEFKRMKAAGFRSKPHKREQPYFEFFTAIKKAKSKGKAKLVKTIFQHAAMSWQAAAWLLERRYPDQFALRTRSELTGKDGGPIQHEHASVTLVLPDNGRGDATQSQTHPETAGN